jgi:signal transduction histidine kinase/CheY-like chemotaxis protein
MFKTVRLIMQTRVDVINEIREKQLLRGIQCLTILAFFVLIVSLSRAYLIGWHNLMYIHIGSYLLILGIAFFKKSIPYIVKAVLIVSTTFILASSGLVVLGLAGYGIACFFLFCILSTIFFGIRGGISAVILSTASIGIIGAAVVNDILTYDFNILVYLTSVNTWATAIVGMIVFAGLIVVILATINNQLVGLVETLDKRNKKLIENNIKLVKTFKEKKKLQSGLEQAKKMELVGTIAGGVAHDLNNVLVASISYPELLLAEISKTSTLREALETIKKSGLKAAAIVQDLLTLARRGVPVEEVLNLNHIVNEFLESPEFEKIREYHPGVNIEVRLEKNLWNIIGSPFHLMKMITNLVSNAAEAMPNGGNIIISTQALEIDEINYIYENVSPGNYVVMTVSDEGIGISNEDKEKIFEPFYTKKFMGKSGTGLGMTVVWNTVKDHKGHISVDSIEGAGTTFSLYFPMTGEALAEKKSQLPISKYAGKRESILVVDDVEEQRKIASKILTMLGYSVTTVSSGEEAVEYFKEHSSDLVILDMIMSPGMDGCNTYKEMIKIRPGQKAILVSGYAETERVREAQKLGAKTYIKKPFLLEKLGLAIRAELDRMTIGNNN